MPVTKQSQTSCGYCNTHLFTKAAGPALMCKVGPRLLTSCDQFSTNYHNGIPVSGEGLFPLTEAMALPMLTVQPAQTPLATLNASGYLRGGAPGNVTFLDSSTALR